MFFLNRDSNKNPYEQDRFDFFSLTIDVGTCGEESPLARDDSKGSIRVFIECSQSGDRICNHAASERIQLLWTIELDFSSVAAITS